MGTHSPPPPPSVKITYLGLVSQSVSQSPGVVWHFSNSKKGKRKREKKSKMPKKTPWQEEKGEEEKDKDNIIDDDVNDDDHEATASETLLSKPSRRETTTTNNDNIPFPHHHPPYSLKQQRHPHHHQTRLILLTSILLLCPCIFLLGFALGSSRQTTTTTTTQSITNDDINDNNNNINTNQPYFSHPSKPSPFPLPLPPLHPLHLEKEKETPPFPPNPSLQQKNFNGSFFHETKFRAKASPEVDRVWDSLGINCSFISSLSSAKKVYQLMAFFLDRSILIPPHLAQPLGLKPNQHVHAKRKFGGGYVANLEGLHHLHCLVCLMLFSCTLCCGGKSCHVCHLLTCFFGGDILFRIYCVKLFIGIFRIIIVVVKGRFEMMRGLWRGMLVSFFLISQVLFVGHKLFSNRQDRNNY